jgi:hypothetical protein
MVEKLMHWISVPHEGPREVEFELEWVEFSDGITRGICTSDEVPVDYWPRAVYVANMASGAYEVVGRWDMRPPQTPSARRVLIFL